MNDRFKFRVWDNNKKEYLDKGYIHRKGYLVMPTMKNDYSLAEAEGDFIIEQCTGLKDINGTFIYENDIVVWNDGGGEVELKPKEGHVRIARVQLFPDLHFKLVGGYPKGTYTMGEEFHFGNFIYKNTEKYLKIVGNIHEKEAQ